MKSEIDDPYFYTTLEPKAASSRHFNGYKANKVRNYMITDFCDDINELDEFLADKVELYDEKYTSLLPFKKRVSRILRYVEYKVWLCVAVIAVCSAGSGIISDYCGGMLFNARITIIALVGNVVGRYFVWVCVTMALGLFTTFLCDKFSKEAEGSGIPELKTYLSGLKITNYINAKSYLVKIVGLILIDGGGFFIGKEGPLIRLSAMVARVILRHKIFSKLNKSSFRRNQMMIVSVAAGVVSTFGASYGGLMFSIEICTTTFLISNLWRGFICASIVKIIYILINSESNLEKFVDVRPQDLLSGQMIVNSLMVGLLCGWLGSFWIYCFCKLQMLKSRISWTSNRYIWVGLVAFIIASVNFFLPTSYIPAKKLLMDLFYEKDLRNLNLVIAERADFFFILIFLTLLDRYIITLLFASCPIPNGIFLPSLIIGALIGR